MTAAEAYADPERGPRDGRPWVLLGMIVSVDGATAVAQRSGGLGGAGDKAVFHALRDLADVILVGAGTARTERYGPPRRPGQRVAVVTASGRLDGAERLLTSGAAVVVTTDLAPIEPDTVEVLRAGADRVDLARALRMLGDQGSRIVLCEGGPALNGALFDAGVIDEICVTTSPLIVSANSSRMIQGPGRRLQPIGLRLAHVLADEEGFVYTRWLSDPLARITPPDRVAG